MGQIYDIILITFTSFPSEIRRDLPPYGCFPFEDLGGIGKHGAELAGGQPTLFLLLILFFEFLFLDPADGVAAIRIDRQVASLLL